MVRWFTPASSKLAQGHRWVTTTGSHHRGGMIEEGGGMLLRLPPELRVEVASHLQPAGLLALGGACRACRAAADHESLWRELLHRQLQPMLHAFFDGALPPPEAPGRSWKRHYFDFRGSWKRLAQKRTGRLLVQIGKQRPSNHPISARVLTLTLTPTPTLTITPTPTLTRQATPQRAGAARAHLDARRERALVAAATLTLD